VCCMCSRGDHVAWGGCITRCDMPLQGRVVCALSMGRVGGRAWWHGGCIAGGRAALKELHQYWLVGEMGVAGAAQAWACLQFLVAWVRGAGCRGTQVGAACNGVRGHPAHTEGQVAVGRCRCPGMAGCRHDGCSRRGHGKLLKGVVMLGGTGC
jgi:hypothetical protein